MNPGTENETSGALAPSGAPAPPTSRVPAAAYDERYFLEHSAGSSEWAASDGHRVCGAYPGLLDLARLRPGEVLVDVGTGRGELLAVAAQRGARRAIGVDYSPAAVKLARQTIAIHEAGDRAEVRLADARTLPVSDASADLVTLLEVVEHLSPAELDRALDEALRVLKPGGRVFVHTFPNRSIVSITYRLQRLPSRRRRRTWPKDPRTDYERRMHVNEQTVTSLRRALRRAGFERSSAWVGQWIYTGYVPEERAKKLYHRLARVPLASRLAVGNILAEGTKPSPG